jgi:Subunit CCDC53 of WASH complex
VAEDKLNEVDDKLDKIEQILSLFEAKLDSVPEEFFDDLP